MTTTDVDVEDTLVSGKIGVLYKLTDNGNAYVSFGTTKTPPGTANFALSAQANNQNNPNTDPQISRNLEVGSKWNFYGSRLSLTGAAFRTKNENVIFTVDATAVPPVFNQDDAQEVTGVSLGVAGRVVRAWDVTANIAYLDSENLSQNAANAGRRLTLAPVVLGQRVDHLHDAVAAERRRRRPLHRRRLHQRRQHHPGARLRPGRRHGDLRRDRASCRCG